MTRRNFFTWGSALVASIAALGVLLPGKKKAIDKVKLLTRDGRLVETDRDRIPVNIRLASKQEVQQWVWPATTAEHNKDK